MNTCNVEDCEKVKSAKNLCRYHYFKTKHYTGRTYTSYRAMKQRCYNKNYKGYQNYEGRGIRVCQRWLESFSNFLEDMGERPEGKIMRRFDFDEDYSPNNCRWAKSYE